jgi:23S rRNA (adenine2503-C2)-methyltransferase
LKKEGHWSGVNGREEGGGDVDCRRGFDVVVMAMAAGRLIASAAVRCACTRRLIAVSASVQNSSQSVSVSSAGVSDFAGVHGLGVSSSPRKVSLKDMTYPELESWVESHGHKASRATILWRHLYGNGKWVESPDVIPRLNKEFVSLLEERAEFAPNLQLRDVHVARDGTRKPAPFVEEYNASVETVVIPGPRGRITVCVSSQIGCAMNCQFCFTAKMGLRGNLTTAQIVEQLVVASRICSQDSGPVTNVVFMGMGEPLHNLDSVIRAADIMVSDKGLHLSPRKVTISTSGLVPQIRTFCRTSKCALAVSLNATTDELRDRIMPINRKYNIRTLLDCVKEELTTYRPGEAVFFEYVMLKNINDSAEDAARLVELVQDIPCKINLITFNSHPGSAFEPTPLDEVLRFRDRVADAGFVVHIRNSRGDDEKMACGQLGTVLPRPPRRRTQEIPKPA